jgi:histidinol-phosphate phosphatase family protein
MQGLQIARIEGRRYERPRQAVILAGGRGTRMRPLTDDKPKCMIPILGKPFLEYQLRQLRNQGVDRVLLLLGYLPQVVRDYFGDGAKWGLQIEYSVTAPDQLTSSRVAAARDLIDPCFLLLYCDNYWPMQIDRLWGRFCEAGKPGLITVYRNMDGYSRGSVALDADGHVAVFDRLRTAPDLKEVEISYAILTDLALELLPDADVLFEEGIYAPLAQQKRLTAFITDHRYYSVGSPHRLASTEIFMRRQKTVILDRDGVLNRSPKRADYVRSWDEWQWCPGALEALQLLNAGGFRTILATNQPGVARGLMSVEQLDVIHQRMKQEIAAAGGNIDAIYCCTHGWNDGCDCRKPKPGLLYQAQRDLHLDLTCTPFLGDEDRDEEAAVASGCVFHRVTESRPLRKIVGDLTSQARSATCVRDYAC